MKADQERVKVLLTDTVTLLCRNGLHFQKQLRVQGVLGITVDDTDVFIVHINEVFSEQQGGTVTIATGHAPVAARVDEQQGAGGEPYYMTSLIGTLPQFTQNPLDGSIQMIGTAGVATRLNNAAAVVAANQKHKCADTADDGRSKRQKSDTGGVAATVAQQAQYLPVMHGSSTAGTKLFATCTALPRGDEFQQADGIRGLSNAQGGAVAAVSKDEKRNKQVTVSAMAAGGGGTAGQVLQQQQWQFATAAIKAPEKMSVANAVIDQTHCYMQYTTPGGCIEDQAATSGGTVVTNAGNKRKANTYSSISVPTVSFVTGMPVDFNAVGVSNAHHVNSRADASSQASNANNKIWENAQQQQQTHQQQQQTQQQQLMAGVFDPMTGCTPWTVSQLMTSQGLLQTDDHQQTQESIQAINQLGMLGYSAQGSDPTDPASSSAGAIDMQQRGSKESRRSWTSKHKPHTCQHPGCRKSYFFVHDLRRHLRQKHDGMDYNETLGKYEPASVGEGEDGAIQGVVVVGAAGEDGVGGGSPMEGHGGGGGETEDDGSPDESDDNEEDDVMAMALTGGGGGAGGKEVAT